MIPSSPSALSPRTISTFSLGRGHTKARFQLAKQFLAFAGNVNRLFLAAFRANPRSQILRRCINKPAFASDRYPLVLPALRHRDRLAQEFRDLSPAFQDSALRVRLHFEPFLP